MGKFGLLEEDLVNQEYERIRSYVSAARIDLDINIVLLSLEERFARIASSQIWIFLLVGRPVLSNKTILHVVSLLSESETQSGTVSRE